jgi:hypothetical protein
MPEQITLVLKPAVVARFLDFLAQPEFSQYRLVDHQPDASPAGAPNHSVLIIEAEESWQFFKLGWRWAAHEGLPSQEGGPSLG